MSATNSIILMMLVSLKPDQQQKFVEFAQKNGPLLKHYGIEPIKTIAINIKGQLAGENLIPQPDFVSLFKVPSMEQFMAYMADPQYTVLSALRAEATSNVIGYFGHEQSLPCELNSKSEPSDRMYVVGLASFKNQSPAGLELFNQRAIETGLFEAHGMHVEYQLQPFKAAAVVGDHAVVTPDRIQVFFVDKPENLKNYISDPLYKELSPLRDETLDKYDFFAGSLK